ncbi:MAG: hypothetical protein OHK005_19330 [Candidatus Methylacidiphilales bacterium]
MFSPPPRLGWIRRWRVSEIFGAGSGPGSDRAWRSRSRTTFCRNGGCPRGGARTNGLGRLRFWGLSRRDLLHDLGFDRHDLKVRLWFRLWLGQSLRLKGFCFDCGKKGGGSSGPRFGRSQLHTKACYLAQD